MTENVVLVFSAGQKKMFCIFEAKMTQNNYRQKLMTSQIIISDDIYDY